MVLERNLSPFYLIFCFLGPLGGGRVGSLLSPGQARIALCVLVVVALRQKAGQTLGFGMAESGIYSMGPP